MNLKIKRKVLTLALLFVLSFTLISCSEKKSDRTLDKEELILGFDDTFVPMGFKNENGEYTGFDIELAKEFSTPYLNNRQVIITLANSKINTKADLAGAVVGAQNQSSAVDAIEADGDIISTFKDGKVVTFDTNNEALMDLEAGRLDAVVADEILAKYYTNQRGADKYKVLKEDFGSEAYAVGMRKDDKELVDAFNKAFKEVVDEGKAGEISKKWFGEDIIAK